METKLTYQVYGKRWILLAGLCACCFCGRFVMNSFSSTIDVVQEYFGVSKYQSELLIHGYYSSEIFFCLLMVAVGSHLGFRILSIAMSSISLLFALTTAIAFYSRNFYGIALIGNLLIGVATTFTFVLTPVFSTAWFPPNEVGTALSIAYAHQSLAVPPSILIFTQFLPKFEIEDTTGNLTSSEIETMSANRVRNVFMANMSVIVGLLALTTIMFWIFSADRPPSPPSASQATFHESKEISTFKVQAKKNILQTLDLCFNKDYMLLSMSNALASSAVGVTILLYQSMLHGSFPDLDERPGGYLAITSHVLGIVGNLLAGRMMDKFRKYKSLTLLGVSGTMVCILGVVIGHFIKILPVIFIFSSCAFLFRRYSINCYIEFLVETAYPTNNTIVLGTHLSMLALGMFSISSLEGYILHRWGVFATLAIPIVGNALALALTSQVEPNYRRSNANERTGLLKAKK